VKQMTNNPEASGKRHRQGPDKMLKAELDTLDESNDLTFNSQKFPAMDITPWGYYPLAIRS